MSDKLWIKFIQSDKVVQNLPPHFNVAHDMEFSYMA